MKNQKLLSDYQKQRLVVAIEALNNPIFSTLKIKALRKNRKAFFVQVKHKRV